MSLLDGLLGGAVGAEMATVVNSFIQQHGGVQGIVAQLEKQGLGATVQSWIGTGPNQPISPDQVHQVFGSGSLAQIAAKAGLNPQELAQKLSQVLPTAIDKLTPEGRVPSKPA
ncbi:MAG TPA: YidB family protein [Steroidobacteraceae bacterium]|nr:YidB family protein [Steroidobacteraceae bacterium]